MLATTLVRGEQIVIKSMNLQIPHFRDNLTWDVLHMDTETLTIMQNHSGRRVPATTT